MMENLKKFIKEEKEKIKNSHMAQNLLVSILKKEKILEIKSTNKGRDRIIKTKKNKYYMKFQKEFFMTFSKVFPTEKGVGVSINEECLKNAIRCKCDYVVLVRPNGKVYTIPSKLWWRYAVKRNLIRTQIKENVYRKMDYSGNMGIVHERTMSVPISLFKRLGEDSK